LIGIVSASDSELFFERQTAEFLNGNVSSIRREHAATEDHQEGESDPGFESDLCRAFTYGSDHESLPFLSALLPVETLPRRGLTTDASQRPKDLELN
jgi:hypothetical protein